MKTILVPTDFSKAATNACEYAAKFAKKFNARLLLLHVFHTPVQGSGIPIITANEIQKDNEVLLKKEAIHLKKISGVEVTYIVKMGLALDEILEEGKNATIIIMGMKGAGKLSEVVIGSITTATLRKANIPVIVIPENAAFKNPEKIVFACDYDPGTDVHILDALKELMITFDSKIYVVNVKEKRESVLVEEDLTRIKLEGKLHNANQVYYFPENKDLVEGINDFVESNHADMVVVIPHRYSIMDRLFHKSISKKMAFHTKVPLLAMPDNHKLIPAYFL